MSKIAFTRTNFLLLEIGKARRLRNTLQSRSNSEAVRRAIDERLAMEAGLRRSKITNSGSVGARTSHAP
jgi:hypothetical protein